MPICFKPQRQPCPDAHDDVLGQDLVQGGPGHGQHDRVARVWVHGADGQAEGARRIVRQGARDGRAVGDGVPLVVGIVDPDRVESGIAGPSRPVDDVGDVTPGRNPQTDAT